MSSPVVCPVIRAAVFDLDDTLVNTTATKAARDRREWAEVARRLAETKSFVIDGVQVDQIPAMLRERGLKIGVLTHAPRWYAESLLERFAVPTDVLVTGSDGYPPKPDPTSLTATIRELGVAREECVYVGDLYTDAAAAAAAGALAVGTRWAATDAADWRRWWPDIAISKPGLLLQLDELDRLRPFAEARLRGVDPVWHWGTVMRVGPDVRACGRYFTPEDLERFPQDPLSALVLRSKTESNAAERVGQLFAEYAQQPAWQHPLARPQMVVSVPRKPGQDFDRFRAARAAVADALGARDAPDALEMAFDVPDYKKLSSEERREANQGRFRAQALAGERVLLIDDVLTSGGQTNACRDALLAAGATWVGIVALAAAQDRLAEPCPECGGRLRVRHRHSDGQAFVGCSNYPNCTFTRDL